MPRQKYHTHARLREELEELSHAHPALCSLYSLGTTSQGRDILAVKITQVLTDGDDSDVLMLYDCPGCRHGQTSTETSGQVCSR